MRIMVIILILSMGKVASAQVVQTNYQLSLIGLRQTDDKSQQGTIAVVVGNRVVIRQIKARPQQIQDLKKSLGVGGCGCGG